MKRSPAKPNLWFAMIKRYYSRKNNRITSDTECTLSTSQKGPYSSRDDVLNSTTFSYADNKHRGMDLIGGGRPTTNIPRIVKEKRPLVSDWRKNAFSKRGSSKLQNFDYVYGISPVRIALLAGRREVSAAYIQEGLLDDFTKRKKDPALASNIIHLCEQRMIGIQYVSKHDLNMMTDNKPHQGIVLRASTLRPTPISSLPSTNSFKCVLALDEVTDPQNLGALIRSMYFLTRHVAPFTSPVFHVDVSVVVCQKNSAPLSPAVSKASAGALEATHIHSTKNMMKFLDSSKENGWHVVGTSSHSQTREVLPVHELSLDRPVIVVLGNEGYGVRKNVLNRCETLVTIASKQLEQSSKMKESKSSCASAALTPSVDHVDSLNVSVCGGIIMHHILLHSPQT